DVAADQREASGSDGRDGGLRSRLACRRESPDNSDRSECTHGRLTTQTAALACIAPALTAARPAASVLVTAADVLARERVGACVAREAIAAGAWLARHGLRHGGRRL